MDSPCLSIHLGSPAALLVRDGPQFCFPRRPSTSPVSSGSRVCFNPSFLSPLLSLWYLKRVPVHCISLPHQFRGRRPRDGVQVVLLGTFRDSHCWRTNPSTACKVLTIFPSHPASLLSALCLNITQHSPGTPALGSWHPRLPLPSYSPRPLLLIFLVSMMLPHLRLF